MSRDADLEAIEMKVFSLPLCSAVAISAGAVLKAAVMCAVGRRHSTLCFLLNPSVQHGASGTAGTSGTRLASCVETHSQDGWLCVGPPVMRNQRVHQLNTALIFCASTFCLGPSM